MTPKIRQKFGKNTRNLSALEYLLDLLMTYVGNLNSDSLVNFKVLTLCGIQVFLLAWHINFHFNKKQFQNTRNLSALQMLMRFVD